MYSGFIHDFLVFVYGGGGRSLGGIATASCMSMRLVLSMRLYKAFWGGGGNSRAPTLCMKPCYIIVGTVCQVILYSRQSVPSHSICRRELSTSIVLKSLGTLQIPYTQSISTCWYIEHICLELIWSVVGSNPAHFLCIVYGVR